MPHRSTKKIALFGGSFNPPHQGHLEIARRVASRTTIDEVWVLPVWRHPFRKKLPAFEKRMGECRRFFLGKKIKVKPYEKRPGATGHTIDLLLFLRRKFPSTRFWWVLGSDAYAQRKRWRRFGLIRKLARLIIIPRGPRSPIPNIASRRLRQTSHY